MATSASASSTASRAASQPASATASLLNRATASAPASMAWRMPRLTPPANPRLTSSRRTVSRTGAISPARRSRTAMESSTEPLSTTTMAKSSWRCAASERTHASMRSAPFQFGTTMWIIGTARGSRAPPNRGVTATIRCASRARPPARGRSGGGATPCRRSTRASAAPSAAAAGSGRACTPRARRHAPPGGAGPAARGCRPSGATPARRRRPPGASPPATSRVHRSTSSHVKK